MNQLEQVRQMCMAIVSKHVNAGVMRSVEATTRADTVKLIAAEIAALELPTASYKQYGYAVLLRSQINEPLPTFDSIWAEYTVAQDHIKEQIQILLDNGETSDECDLVAVPVYIQSEQSTEQINHQNSEIQIFSRENIHQLKAFEEAELIRAKYGIELENFVKKLRSNLPASEQANEETSSLPQTILTTDVITTNRLKTCTENCGCQCDYDVLACRDFKQNVMHAKAHKEIVDRAYRENYARQLDSETDGGSQS